MVREYPNLSIYLSELMNMNGIDKSYLSLKTEIKPAMIEKMLNGSTTHLTLLCVCKLSNLFEMSICDFIDYVSN